MQINKQDVVAVVLGGPSSEAEISRVTGGAIANALREKGYNAKEVELNPSNLINELRDMNAKVVLTPFMVCTVRMAVCRVFWRQQVFLIPAAAYWQALFLWINPLRSVICSLQAFLPHPA